MSPYPADRPDAVGAMRIVLVAAPDGPAADRLVDKVLARRLAACVQATRIRSTYWWQGRIEAADERLLAFKTLPKRVGALFRLLAAEHPYAVPEIVEIDVPRVHGPYLEYLVGTVDPAEGLRDGAERRPMPPATRRGSRRARGARSPGRTRAPRRRP